MEFMPFGGMLQFGPDPEPKNPEPEPEKPGCGCGGDDSIGLSEDCGCGGDSSDTDPDPEKPKQPEPEPEPEPDSGGGCGGGRCKGRNPGPQFPVTGHEFGPGWSNPVPGLLTGSTGLSESDCGCGGDSSGPDPEPEPEPGCGCGRHNKNGHANGMLQFGTDPDPKCGGGNFEYLSGLMLDAVRPDRPELPYTQPMTRHYLAEIGHEFGPGPRIPCSNHFSYFGFSGLLDNFAPAQQMAY